MPAPSPDIVARVEKLLGWTPDIWRPVHGGYTPTARYAVADGARTAFVKVATTDVTARQINREIVAYNGIAGSFVPTLLGADPDPNVPILIIGTSVPPSGRHPGHPLWSPRCSPPSRPCTQPRRHCAMATCSMIAKPDGRPSRPTRRRSCHSALSRPHGLNMPCPHSSLPRLPAPSPATRSPTSISAATTSASRRLA